MIRLRNEIARDGDGRKLLPQWDNRVKFISGTAAAALMVVMLAHMALRTSIALPTIIEQSEARATW